MKEVLLNNITNKIKETYHYDDIKIKEIRYGLEVLLISIVKLIIVFVVSLFIHTTKELCVFYATYLLLRLFGFGLHAKNSFQCWILTIPIFILIPYLIKTLRLNNTFYYLIILFIIPLIIYAPADTEKRPLYNSKKRKLYKSLIIILSTIYLLVIIFSNNYFLKNSIFFSIILETLLVLPISYKLLGLKYSNYKRDIRKEVKK